MQGGIRRKKDLLPRYKKNGVFGSPRNKSYLTTPMKKILAYIGLLFIVYLVLKVAYSDLNKIPTYELERLQNEKKIDAIVKSGDNDDADSSTIDALLKDLKQNDNKNNLIMDQTNNNNNNNNNKDSGNVDTRKKIPKDKFNNEVAMQQETKNLENDLKPHVDVVDESAAAKIAQNDLIV